ncbi:MAG TPA: nucleotide exchange factor GrpE [Acidobacteriota bacterium]|nr:nucleotide exchange factor GrpE [Acidobacteriota bacterium]
MSDKEHNHFRVADRRFWVQDEGVFDRAEIPEKKYPSYVEELKSRTELAEKKLREKLRQLEEDNELFRERLRRENERRLQSEKHKLVAAFLEVADNMERALQAPDDPAALKEGIRLNLELFLSRLKSEGIEQIDPVNQPFDPNEAEAVGMTTVDEADQDHLVVEVVQKGYRVGDQLIRPARVRVGQYRG